MEFKDYHNNVVLRIVGDKCYDPSGTWAYVRNGDYICNATGHWVYEIRDDRVYDTQGNWVYKVSADQGRTPDIEPTPVFCAHCKHKLKAASTFCSNCGTPSGSNNPPTPPIRPVVMPDNRGQPGTANKKTPWLKIGAVGILVLIPAVIILLYMNGMMFGIDPALVGRWGDDNITIQFSRRGRATISMAGTEENVTWSAGRRRPGEMSIRSEHTIVVHYSLETSGGIERLYMVSHAGPPPPGFYRILGPDGTIYGRWADRPAGEHANSSIIFVDDKRMASRWYNFPWWRRDSVLGFHRARNWPRYNETTFFMLDREGPGVITITYSINVSLYYSISGSTVTIHEQGAWGGRGSLHLYTLTRRRR